MFACRLSCTHSSQSQLRNFLHPFCYPRHVTWPPRPPARPARPFLAVLLRHEAPLTQLDYIRIVVLVV